MLGRVFNDLKICCALKISSKALHMLVASLKWLLQQADLGSINFSKSSSLSLQHIPTSRINFRVKLQVPLLVVSCWIAEFTISLNFSYKLSKQTLLDFLKKICMWNYGSWYETTRRKFEAIKNFFLFEAP